MAQEQRGAAESPESHQVVAIVEPGADTLSDEHLKALDDALARRGSHQDGGGDPPRMRDASARTVSDASSTSNRNGQARAAGAPRSPGWTSPAGPSGTVGRASPDRLTLSPRSPESGARGSSTPAGVRRGRRSSIQEQRRSSIADLKEDVQQLVASGKQRSGRRRSLADTAPGSDVDALKAAVESSEARRALDAARERPSSAKSDAEAREAQRRRSEEARMRARTPFELTRAEQKKVAAWVKQMAQFAAMDASDVDRMVRVFQPFRVPSGHVIIREGDTVGAPPGDSGDMYFIWKGQVVVTRAYTQKERSKGLARQDSMQVMLSRARSGAAGASTAAGLVAMLKRGAAGEERYELGEGEKYLASLFSGKFFGEHAAAGRVRNANVRAPLACFVVVVVVVLRGVPARIMRPITCADACCAAFVAMLLCFACVARCVGAGCRRWPLRAVRAVAGEVSGARPPVRSS